MATDRGRGRIVVVSASIGAGHDGAARELARRLRGRGFEVDCHDFMKLLPGRVGGQSLDLHGLLLRRAPWAYGVLFAIGNLRRTASITRVMLFPVRRRLMALVTDDVRAVVSVYPLASQVLGPLRRRGALTVPAITYATDFAVHRHWVAPGVDAHLAPHRVGAAQAHAQGGRGAVVAGALVAPGFRPPFNGAKQAARRRFGLPSGRLALVVAGSWGVGQIEAAAAEIARTGAAIPVIACGHNAELRSRLRDQGLRYALGWVDDMPTLMQAVDVLVENAGGLMALEGMACALPVMTYRPIPGHGRESAAALVDAGIATWVRDRKELGELLIELADGERGDNQQEAASALFDADPAAMVARLASAKPNRAVVGRASVRREGRDPRRARNRTAVAVGAAIAVVAAIAQTRRTRLTKA